MGDFLMLMWIFGLGCLVVIGVLVMVLVYRSGAVDQPKAESALRAFWKRIRGKT